MNAKSQQKLIVVLVAAAFSAPLASTSLAQERAPSATQVRSAKADQSGPDMRASKLIGMDVQNATGEDIGEVKDLIVDVTGERVHYAVLSYGGALGVGDKLFAYPISTFKRTGDTDKLVLDIDKERLKNAPGFDSNRWPDLADNRYRKEVDRYFRSNAVGATPKGERLVRASELIGKNVDDRQGANAGEIEDLVVNLASERIRYVVLDFDKAWSPDDKLVTLPLGAFNFPERKDRDLVLDVSREQISTARTFDEKAWPDLNARSFRREVDAFLARFQKDRTTSSGSSGSSEAETSSSGSR